MARTIVENGKTLRLTGLTDRKFGIELELFATRENPSDHAAIVRALTEAGVECKYEGYHHNTRPYWKVVTDASVETPNGRKGLELVSPPLSGEEGLREVEKVCGALATIGAWVSRSCGMHVHHDAADMNIDAIKDLAWLMNRFAPVFDGLVPLSRRAGQNRFCEHWSEYHLTELARVRTLGDLRMRYHGESHARYRTLNVCSVQRHGTVEFRQHGGTVEGSKIVAWTLLTQGLVEKAQAARVKKTQMKATGDGIDNMIRAAGLRTCKPHGQKIAPEHEARVRNTVKYLMERARHFGVIQMKDRSIERSRAKRAAAPAVETATPEALVARAVAEGNVAATTPTT
jgi:hypothetical protein